MTWAVEAFLQEVLESLLAQGYRIDSLGDPRELGSKGGAWRVALRSPDEGMPSSVVIKRAGPALAGRYQDWTCQYFLSDLVGTKGLGPEFFAADEGVGFYVLEDLGLGTDPGRVLAVPDSRSRLAAGLLACSLAGLHAGTFGRERTFALLRERLPGASPDRAAEQQAWRADVEAALNGLQAGLAADIAPVLGLLADEMRLPYEFLTLTAGDWEAKGLWYGDQGPRLLSLESGAYRHALLDLAAWELRCHGNEPAWETLDREYLSELDRLGADRGDRFGQALGRARAWMALWHLAAGTRAPGMQAMLALAAQDPELEALGRVISLL
jgi:hypothetical protein